MAAQLTTIFDEVRRDLRALNARSAHDLPRPLVEDLMLAIYHLGTALEQDPSLRDAPELRAFVDELQPALRASLVDLVSYPSNVVLHYQTPWDGGEWEQLCRTRSAIQFFVELVRDTPFGADLEDMELDDLDEHLRKWGRREGGLAPEAVDPGIPRSHWWWQYPEP